MEMTTWLGDDIFPYLLSLAQHRVIRFAGSVCLAFDLVNDAKLVFCFLARYELQCLPFTFSTALYCSAPSVCVARHFLLVSFLQTRLSFIPSYLVSRSLLRYFHLFLSHTKLYYCSNTICQPISHDSLCLVTSSKYDLFIQITFKYKLLNEKIIYDRRFFFKEKYLTKTTAAK